jgi:transposase
MRRMSLEVLPEEAQELQRRVRSHTVAVRDRQRARIILLAVEGLDQKAIAAKLGPTRATVGQWCRRYRERSLAGLAEAPGRGRKPRLSQAKVRRVLETVGKPPAHLGRWSCRTMAAAAGISKARVQRLWAAHDIKPHLNRQFKLSKDKRFEAKVWDVIGLYLAPPDKAVVLCCDEKTQMQALERTQPGLPLGIGHIRTRTHDYIRHGTLTLFAALNYLEGKLPTALARKHRPQEWLAFLRRIDRETPQDLDLHLILDNYATHKHQAVKAWRAKHPRMPLHFTPTSSSWMTLVERFFRDLGDFLAEGSFGSVKALAEAIIAFLAERNAHPKRYVWNAKGEDILRKIVAARNRMEQICA